MKRLIIPFGAMAAVVAACALGIAWHDCAGGARMCATGIAAESGRSLLLSAQLVGLVGLTAVFGRAGWLLIRASSLASRLPVGEAPVVLAAAATRAGLRGIICVRADSCHAFTVGLLRPRVHVTDGLVAALSADELIAVLCHEREHARGRHPLRQALRCAAGEVLFFLPVLRWWAGRQGERAEVAADGAAIAAVGRQAVAGALWVTSDDAAVVGITPRLDQLAGRRTRLTAPQRAVVLASFVGSLLAVVLLACAATLMAG